MAWKVSIVVGESGKSEEEVMVMPLRKVFAYEHCWYAKKGIRCTVQGAGATLEELFFS